MKAYKDILSKKVCDKTAIILHKMKALPKEARLNTKWATPHENPENKHT